MRKFLVAAAVATTALTAAAPAAAQYYPAPNPYQQPYYGQGYGYGQNNYGLVRSYEARIANVRRAIERADSRDRISEREARSLRNEAQALRNRVRSLGYNGLNGRERRDIDYRLARLERRFAVELRDRDGRRNGYYGNDGWSDRDRDGRNDRYEDDRGRYPG